LLAFIFANRDFSKGYRQENKKISSTLRLAWRVVVATFQTAAALSRPAGAERESNSVQQNTVTNSSDFVKAIRYRRLAPKRLL
jgi:hypothetical protein